MHRLFVCVLISVVCLVSGGCPGTMMHGFTHSHSEITAPTFCLYDGRLHSKDTKPQPIYELRVARAEQFSDDKRFEWRNWQTWSKGRYDDQMSWEIEYVGDDQANPLTRPFSCITYGKVPPGYDETIPAQPLIPERVYTVQLLPKSITPMSWVYFIIRADSQGQPTQLEVGHDGPEDILIINQE